MNFFTISNQVQQDVLAPISKPLIDNPTFRKIMRIWTITMVILTVNIQLFSAASVDGQAIDQVQINLELKNESLVKAFKKIEAQSPFYFMYRNQDVKGIRNLSITASKQSVANFLEIILANTLLSYRQIDQRILITVKRDNFVSRGAELFNTPPDNSEDIVVRGQVTDDKGEILPGVNIILKGTTIGTSTDSQGSYTISVPDNNSILVFTYIGFVTQEIEVNNQTTINVKMEPAKTSLKEVVVTALGIERETRSLTYSAQNVNTKQLSQTREPNLMTALQGKVAGLSINESGNGVGAASRVVLRGDRSISGDSQPLYVVDGVPIRGNPEQLNTDNIASIDVLKGPNAAALYGSAAQNGVIIITTKSGQAGVAQVSVNSSFIMVDPIIAYQFQNVYGQGNGGLYSRNSESSWGPKMEDQMVDHWSPDPSLAGTKYAFTPQPDNVRDYFRRGYNKVTNLLASIGGEKIQAMFAYTLTNAQGTISNNVLKRHNVSVRINSQISKRILLDSKLDYMHQAYTGGFYGNSYGNVGQIYTMPRNIQTEQVENFEYESPDGSILQNYWYPGSTVSKNPYWTLNRDINESALGRVIGMTSLSYKFSNPFKLMVRASFDEASGSNQEKIHNDNYNIGQFGLYSVGRSNGMEWNGDALLSYSKDITDNWNIDANFGGNIKQRRNGSLSSNTGTALIVPNFFALSNTLQVQSSNDVGLPVDTQSLYAFGHISWGNSIFLDITGRNDWSSTLPAASRSFFYPSVGLSAVLSDLIPSFPKLFSFAKVRASWAKVGNSTSPYMLDRSATFTGGGRNGFLRISNTLPNTNLRPENTEAFEVGFNVRFFEGRLGLEATAYKTNTRDQLFAIDLPIGSGASQYFTNGGDIQNKGVELILSTTPVQTSKIRWDVNINFAANRNKVLAISDLRSKINVGAYTLEAGKPFGNIYSHGFLRDSLGRVIVASNGMPRITPGRTVLVANFNPDFMGSILSTFTYKNFSFYFLIDHRQGGTIVSSLLPIVFYSGTAKQTLAGRDGGLVFGENLFPHETAVTDDGSPNTAAINAETFWVGMGSTATQIGEAFVEEATNTRLRELSFGYSFPKSMLGRLPFLNVKFSLVGRNLFFIYRASKTSDADLMTGTGPGSLGTESYIRPTSRTFGASLTIDF